MFSDERHQEILNLLNLNKSVNVNELSEKFNVSKATIRSDLNTLEKDGFLLRTHGGAILPVNPILDGGISSYESRKQTNQEEKKKIAEEAISYIEDNDCIALDASSTCYELAKLIYSSDLKNLTIITNGLRTASLLKENTNFTTLIIGGILRPDSNSVETLLGIDLLNKFIIDKSFVSSYSIDCKNGLTDFSLYEIDLKKEMISRSKKAYALIDSSKFDQQSVAIFASLTDIERLITDDSQITRDSVEHFEEFTAVTLV